MIQVKANIRASDVQIVFEWVLINHWTQNLCRDISVLTWLLSFSSYIKQNVVQCACQKRNPFMQCFSAFTSNNIWSLIKRMMPFEETRLELGHYMQLWQHTVSIFLTIYWLLSLCLYVVQFLFFKTWSCKPCFIYWLARFGWTYLYAIDDNLSWLIMY